MNTRSTRSVNIPLLFKEGWPRHQKNGPGPFMGVDGEVVNVATLP